MTPVRYATTVHHRRQSPFRHEFTYRSESWLVDVDHLPHKGFRSRDHVGDPSRTLRENIDVVFGRHHETVLMLTSPRALGHVFNPLTVFWALSASGDVVATVAEVHNTYGGRHAYVLAPGQTSVPKALYVSPFHEVSGRYELRLPLPGEEVRLDITYRAGDGRPFVATVRGRISRGRPNPFTTRIVAWRIRAQGVRLYLRGLPVVRRPRQDA